MRVKTLSDVDLTPYGQRRRLSGGIIRDLSDETAQALVRDGLAEEVSVSAEPAMVEAAPSAPVTKPKARTPRKSSK